MVAAMSTGTKGTKRALWLGGPPGKTIEKISDFLLRYGIEIVEQWQTTKEMRPAIPAHIDLVIFNHDIAGHQVGWDGKSLAKKAGIPFVWGSLNKVDILQNLQNRGLVKATINPLEEALKDNEPVDLTPPRVDARTAFGPRAVEKHAEPPPGKVAIPDAPPSEPEPEVEVETATVTPKPALSEASAKYTEKKPWKYNRDFKAWTDPDDGYAVVYGLVENGSKKQAMRPSLLSDASGARLMFLTHREAGDFLGVVQSAIGQTITRRPDAVVKGEWRVRRATIDEVIDLLPETIAMRAKGKAKPVAPTQTLKEAAKVIGDAILPAAPAPAKTDTPKVFRAHSFRGFTVLTIISDADIVVKGDIPEALRPYVEGL